MIKSAQAAYVAAFVGVLFLGYAFGNGIVYLFLKTICNIICFMKRSIRVEENHAITAEASILMKISTMSLGFLILMMTSMILTAMKKHHGKDRFDELLKESKEALRLTDEFLEKWRTRRYSEMPNESSYLNDELEAVKPPQLEVPVLHMAIIDTCDSSRKQPESGDAGDSISFSDSVILSLISLPDEDSVMLKHSTDEEQLFEDNSVRSIEPPSRYLWDVAEEDPNACLVAIILIMMFADFQIIVKGRFDAPPC